MNYFYKHWLNTPVYIQYTKEVFTPVELAEDKFNNICFVKQEEGTNTSLIKCIDCLPYTDYSPQYIKMWGKPEEESYYTCYDYRIETKLEPLSDYGDHMTIEDFKNCVSCGAFIPDDGSANLATNTEELVSGGVPFKLIMEGNYDKIFTHVMWYNR